MKKSLRRNRKTNFIVRFFKNLFKEKGKKLSSSKEMSYKYYISCFFDGSEYVEPMVNVSLSSLGITNLSFRRFKKETVITITLERPGLLIGKGGSTIDKLQEYLSTPELPVRINIIESRLWN